MSIITINTDIVNEQSVAWYDVTFYDRSGSPIAPASATYRIDDYDSDTEVRDDTAITALAATVTITVDDSDTTILNNALEYEKKIISIKALHGSGDTFHYQIPFYVKNLNYVPFPTTP